ncbi:MAG: diacylglycerol kinase family lipid kinase [Anaerolineae bacterium]|nr:diacylglycerol kinase family lipid kinase [Anaerolineae bacterium]MDW8069018.1 diacylglycerol kinase family lipid kinase [Anaerolineae bacterium]
MRSLIIYNPVAGPRDVWKELKRVRRELAARGWSVEIEATCRPGEATALAREAAQAGMDVVWAAGGDGTVNETVNGLVGTETALGVLPVGTGNVWARQLHLPVYTLTHPFRLREAAVAQAEGRIRSVDVGRLNDRHFLLWVGAGFDAQITSDMEPRTRRVKRLGVLPYVIAGLTLAREFSGVRAHLVLDGRALRGRVLLVVVSNVQMYSIFHLTPRARMDDGLLDVFLFKGLGGFLYMLRMASQLFVGRHLENPRVVQRTARQVTLWTETPMAVQADGEPLGTTPISVRVVPGALRVLVPPQAPPTLFGAA